MKKLLALFLLLFILSACVSRNWHSNKARDVNTYVRKVERKPGNQKYIERLRLAYKEQKDKILLEIESLERLRKPFYWEDMYGKYRILNEMASRIYNCRECSNVQTPVFYKTEQIDALRNATDERMEAGLLALGLNSKPEAQKAYNNFVRAKKLSPERKDLDSLISEALEEGTVRIVLEGDYKHAKDYVRDIEKSLLKELSVASEAKPFYQFFSPEKASEIHLKPDYIVRFGYEYLNVGFEQRNCTEESFSKDIKVSEKKIDSVRVEPIFEKVSAKVTKCRKSVSAEGKIWLEVIDYQSDEIILNDTFYDDDNWINEWVTVSGDSRALPAGAANSGSENFPPTRWMQFANIASELTGSVFWKIRVFMRGQNSLASY